MSAESAVESLIASLNLLSASYFSKTDGLLAQAGASVKGRLPDPPALAWDATRQSTSTERIPRPPASRPVELGEMPKMGKPTAITQGALRFSKTAPTVRVPAYQQPAMPPPPRFEGDTPLLQPLTVPEQADALRPDITDLTPPTLTVPQEVPVDPLSGTPPDLYEPTFNRSFTGDVVRAYEDGLALAGKDTTTAWAAALRGRLAPLEDALTAHLQRLLQGRETALPDTWEEGKYRQAQFDAARTRQKAMDEVDARFPSPTGLPSGAQASARLDVEMAAATAMMTGAGQVLKERQEREIKHLQWALTLTAQLIDTALSLRGQELGWRLKAFLVALDGAGAAQDAALQVLQVQEKGIDLLTQYNDGQRKRLELLTTIEQSKLEALHQTTAHNKNVIAYNDHQVQAHKLCRDIISAKIQVFQTQIEFITLDQAWQRLGLDRFKTETALFKTQLRVLTLEYDALQARIKGDAAHDEGELLKLRAYEAQLKAHAADIRAEQQAMQARRAQNKVLIDTHQAQVQAKMDFLKLAQASVQDAVHALTKSFDAEFAEQKLALQQQRILDEEALAIARNELQRDHVDAVAALKAAHLRLSQNMTLANVLSHGASVTGGIATQAFAGVNAVGSRTLVEGG